MAFNRTVTITGMDEVMKSLAAYPALARTAAAQALNTEGEAIRDDSKDNYVPVDQATLQGSAYVKDMTPDGATIAVEIGYTAEYAAAIHENPRAGKTGGVSPSGRKYRHWATRGGWKYLEIPVMNAEKGMLERIADRMRNSIGGKLA